MKFECIQCGKCCRPGFLENGDPNIEVRVAATLVTMIDAERIADYLGIPITEFLETYTNGHGQINHAREDCPFLTEDNTCSIHEVRPASCAKYPWMGAATDPEWVAWCAERCPGLVDDGEYPVGADIPNTPEWIEANREQWEAERDERRAAIARIEARIADEQKTDN